MDMSDIFFIVTLTLVPSGMAWRAYKVGYQQGCKEERVRQERRMRLSRRTDNR